MRKKLFSLFLVLTVLFSLTACTRNKPETKFILTEFETTLADGTVQKTVHHYNEDWVMTGSTVYRNGEVEMEIVYEQNERGDTASIIYTTADLTQKEEYVCAYDEQGNLVQVDIYVDGEKNASTTIERTYDENGVMTSQIQRSEQMIYEHYYNPDGTVAKTVNHLLYLDDTQTTEYTYDENGNEIRTAVYNAAGVLVSETNSSYDEEGHIQVSVDTRYNEDGSPAETHAAEYTWEGLVKTTHTFLPDGTEGALAVTEYDEAGNMIRHEIYNGDKMMTRQVMTYVQVEVPAE